MTPFPLDKTASEWCKENIGERKMREIKEENLGIGYKVFDSNWKCFDFQYEVGREYEYPGEIRICNSGFHFCHNLIDCFNYKEWNPANKVAIIHYDKSLKIQTGNDKSCVGFIRIVKEIDWNEVYKICNQGLNNTGHRNSGDRNSGHRNSGDWNSGDRNSGDRNSGDWNSGDWNSGDRNSGHRNSGDRNSGDRNSGHRNSGDRNSGDRNSGHRNSGDRNSGDWNSGDRNSGDRNSGDRNSGDWNSGHRNSGFLNSSESTVRIFNIDSGKTFGEVHASDWYRFLCSLDFPINRFIFSSNMSEEEKAQHSYHETLGGYLKTLSYKESWAKAIPEITQEIKEILESIPNWDKDVFYEITGIQVK